MKKFDCILVVTHIAYRKTLPPDPIEGPYSSLCQALSSITGNVSIFGVPLVGYENALVYGLWGNTQKIQIPRFFGNWSLLKFPMDIFLSTTALVWWSIINWNKNKLVIGIDPLSCLPLWLFKKVFGYTLVFHCVDFNKNRFNSKLLQYLYEMADEWASRFSDETWVICEALKDYKKKWYGVSSYYIPNSVVFDPKIYKEGKIKRVGDKIVWTGSLLTNRQYDILFGVLSYIQTEVRSDIKFVIAPTKDYEKFESYAKKYKLKNMKLLKLNSRLEFQKVAARCDVGIALYDEQFGSTEFIEPMKIWDFLLCGLPFIVSSEPSISKPIVDSGVAYFMKPKNQIPDIRSLKLFLSKRNLLSKARACLVIAKNFDIERQVGIGLNRLLSKN